MPVDPCGKEFGLLESKGWTRMDGKPAQASFPTSYFSPITGLSYGIRGLATYVRIHLLQSLHSVVYWHDNETAVPQDEWTPSNCDKYGLCHSMLLSTTP